MKRVAFILSLFLSLTIFPTSSLADNAQDAVDAANEATDAANAATDASLAAAEAADSINMNLRDKIEEAIWVAKTSGSVTIIDVSLGITNCTQRIIDFTKSKEYAESKVLAIQSILDKQDLEVTTRSRYSGTQRTWQSSVNSYSGIINILTIEKSYIQSAQEKINNAAAEKVAADLKAKQDADAKAVADKAAADLKAKQEADAKAAADKAAADLKAKQEADAKAVADKAAADLKAKQEAEANAAADKAAADLKIKQEADAKAAADNAAADLKAKQEADAKAVADKAAADLKAKQDADAKAVADKAAAELKAKQDADAKEVEVLVTNFKKRVQSTVSNLRLRILAIKNLSTSDRKKSEQLQKDLKLVSTELTLISGIGPAISELDNRTTGLVDQVVAIEARYKKTTITCIKGKTIKKVTAVKPVCPKGYKKK